MQKKQNSNKKIKTNIILYLSSFILLGISFLLFIFAFYFEDQKIYYAFCILFLILFCICYTVFNKKIMCEENYNLIQAYLFYKKCEKKGLSVIPTKLKNEQIQPIADLAKNYDYSKDFNEHKVRQLYLTGYNVSNLVDNEILKKGSK